VAAENERQVYRCDCMVLFRYIKELIKANIPEGYWKLTLADLKVDVLAKRLATAFVQNIDTAKRKGLGIVFWGQNGTGKTSLMCEIGKAAIIHHYDVRYFTLSSYISALYAKEDAEVESMEYGDFLLIDELDKFGGKSVKSIDEFFRRMSNVGKSLILSTNWDKEELKAGFGESVYSLLLRKCEFTHLTGNDFSLEVNAGILEQLTGTYDYWHENIKAAAFAREENINE